MAAAVRNVSHSLAGGRYGRDGLAGLGASAGGAAAAPAGPVAADNFAQTIAALTSLGYSATEARDALSKIENKNAPADELLRLALRNMAGM